MWRWGLTDVHPRLPVSRRGYRTMRRPRGLAIPQLLRKWYASAGFSVSKPTRLTALARRHFRAAAAGLCCIPDEHSSGAARAAHKIRCCCSSVELREADAVRSVRSWAAIRSRQRVRPCGRCHVTRNFSQYCTYDCSSLNLLARRHFPEPQLPDLVLHFSGQALSGAAPEPLMPRSVTATS